MEKESAMVGIVLWLVGIPVPLMILLSLYVTGII